MITPEELAHSILHPQVDPLVGQIVYRLLQKTRPSRAYWAKDFNDEEFQLQTYSAWNDLLAKKWGVMFKSYQRFKHRFMKVHQLQNPEQDQIEEKKEMRGEFEVSHDIFGHLVRGKLESAD